MVDDRRTGDGVQGYRVTRCSRRRRLSHRRPTLSSVFTILLLFSITLFSALLRLLFLRLSPFACTCLSHLCANHLPYLARLINLLSRLIHLYLSVFVSRRTSACMFAYNYFPCCICITLILSRGTLDTFF